MSISKAIPPSLRHLVQGSPHDIHRDLSAPSSSRDLSAEANASFRSTTTRNWPSAGGGTDDDFGRFMAGTLPPPAAVGTSTSAGLHWNEQPRDGAAVLAMLGGDNTSSMVNAVDGDWESELREAQSRRGEADLPSLTQDPKATRRRPSPHLHAESHISSGDMSPTSASLLSQLSSLDLASRNYLETLLSLPPDQAFDDYLSQASYTEDVWGPPKGASRLIDRIRDGTSAAVTDSEEEGRQKAVRRLGMILRHVALAQEESASSAQSAALHNGQHSGKGKGKEDEVSHGISSLSPEFTNPLRIRKLTVQCCSTSDTLRFRAERGRRD